MPRKSLEIRSRKRKRERAPAHFRIQIARGRSTFNHSGRQIIMHIGSTQEPCIIYHGLWPRPPDFEEIPFAACCRSKLAFVLGSMHFKRVDDGSIHGWTRAGTWHWHCASFVGRKCLYNKYQARMRAASHHQAVADCRSEDPPHPLSDHQSRPGHANARRDKEQSVINGTNSGCAQLSCSPFFLFLLDFDLSPQHGCRLWTQEGCLLADAPHARSFLRRPKSAHQKLQQLGCGQGHFTWLEPPSSNRLVRDRNRAAPVGPFIFRSGSQLDTCGVRDPRYDTLPKNSNTRRCCWSKSCAWTNLYISLISLAMLLLRGAIDHKKFDRSLGAQQGKGCSHVGCVAKPPERERERGRREARSRAGGFPLSLWGRIWSRPPRSTLATTPTIDRCLLRSAPMLLPVSRVPLDKGLR